MNVAFRRTVIACVGLWLVLLAPTTGSTAEREAPIKLYVDESRSLQSLGPLWKRQLGRAEGYLDVRAMDLLDNDVLPRCDVAVMCSQAEKIAYSTAELAAVRHFVENGGGPAAHRLPRRGRSPRLPAPHWAGRPIARGTV